MDTALCDKCSHPAIVAAPPPLSLIDPNLSIPVSFTTSVKAPYTPLLPQRNRSAPVSSASVESAPCASTASLTLLNSSTRLHSVAAALICAAASHDGRGGKGESVATSVGWTPQENPDGKQALQDRLRAVPGSTTTQRTHSAHIKGGGGGQPGGSWCTSPPTSPLPQQ